MKKSIIRMISLIVIVCMVSVIPSLATSALNEAQGDRFDHDTMYTGISGTQGAYGVEIGHDDTLNQHGYVVASVNTNNGLNFEKSMTCMAFNAMDDIVGEGTDNECYISYQGYSTHEEYDSFCWTANPISYASNIAKEISADFSVVRYLFQHNTMVYDAWTKYLWYEYSYSSTLGCYAWNLVD